MSVITPLDDSLHEPGDDPMWNESAWFSFMVPERNLIGGIHWHHRPNMNLTWQKVVIWDGQQGRGENVYDCVYYDAFELQPFSATNATSNFDFATPMGLTLRTLEPWQQYAISYERNDCVIDLEWTALSAVVSTPYGSKGKGWGVNNYQQPGRVSGLVRVNGSEIVIDGPSNRDRSWGPRNFNYSWNSFPRHQWPWFNDGEGFAGNLYMVADVIGDGTDKIEFAEERMISGWFLKDGVASNTVDGHYMVTERRDGMPSRVEMHATDGHGRTFSATGEAVNFLRRPSPPGLFAFCSMVRWDFGNGDAVYGQIAEVYPHELARRYVRASH